MSKELPKTKAWSIIGAAVHTMNGDEIDRQGHVVQQQDDRILIEWFEWVMGEATYATWHTLDYATSQKWRFFKSITNAKAYFDANKNRLIAPPRQNPPSP